MKRIMASVVGTLALGGSASAQEGPLEVKVITVSEASLEANIALITGETAAALIDVPFTRADTHRVIADVLDSGKALETVYVTHDHPDHFFGIDLIVDSFPEARVLTAPGVAAAIERSYPAKFARWNAMLGANAPRRAVAFEALERGHFELEGRRIDVLGPMQGDHAVATAVWIPESETLIAGDLLFYKVHLWLGEHLPEQRAGWGRSLERLAALEPATVVPGHGMPASDSGADAIAWTRSYLAAFEELIALSENSDDLIGRLRARYPDARDYAGDFILTNSAQVAMGEIEPWDE